MSTSARSVRMGSRREHPIYGSDYFRDSQLDSWSCLFVERSLAAVFSFFDSVRVGVAHRYAEQLFACARESRGRRRTQRTHRTKYAIASAGRADNTIISLRPRTTRMCTIVPRSKAGRMAARLHDRCEGIWAYHCSYSTRGTINRSDDDFFGSDAAWIAIGIFIPSRLKCLFVFYSPLYAPLIPLLACAAVPRLADPIGQLTR